MKLELGKKITRDRLFCRTEYLSLVGHWTWSTDHLTLTMQVENWSREGRGLGASPLAIVPSIDIRFESWFRYWLTSPSWWRGFVKPTGRGPLPSFSWSTNNHLHPVHRVDVFPRGVWTSWSPWFSHFIGHLLIGQAIDRKLRSFAYLLSRRKIMSPTKPLLLDTYEGKVRFASDSQLGFTASS